MESLIFSIGLLVFAVIAILIAIFVKDIKTRNDESNLNNKIANYIANDNSGIEILEYAKHFKKDGGYSSSYKGWR